MDGKAIFVKSYYLGSNPQFVGTAIPGRNGVFGSILSPSFIAVNRYVEKDKQAAAVEFLKYYTSERVQKEYFMKNGIFSIVSDLYKDEEACLYVDCEVIRESKPYIYVGYDTGKYTQVDYYNKIREYTYQHVYGNTSITKTMKKLNDLKKTYYLSMKTTDSSVGLVMLITVCISLFTMNVLLIIHPSKDIEHTFLPMDFWIISLLGSMFIQCTIFTIYGKLTTTKCLIKIIVINTFFLINIIPIFCQLIINFPETNKISKWINKRMNRYLVFSITLVLNFILTGLLFIFPFEVEYELIIDGENYEKCVSKNIFNIVISELIYAIDIIILLSSLLLLFIEWNLEKHLIHSRLMTSLIFIDLLLMIIYEIFNHVNIKSYIINGISLYFITFFISLSNFALVYLSKFCRIFSKDNKGSIEKIIDEFKKNEQQFKSTNITFTSKDTNTLEAMDNSNFTHFTGSQKKNSTTSSANSSAINVIMKYHYRKSVDDNNQLKN